MNNRAELFSSHFYTKTYYLLYEAASCNKLVYVLLTGRLYPTTTLISDPNFSPCLGSLARTMFLSLLWILLPSVINAIVCGQADQCLCKESIVTCSGPVPPEVGVKMRTGRTLEWNMMHMKVDVGINFDKLWNGYTKVVILNAPLEACNVQSLRKYIHGNCAATADATTATVETLTDADATADSTADESSQGLWSSTTKLDSSGVISVDLTVSERAIVIALAVNTAKLGLLGFLVYQIIVSLVYIHSRLNQLEANEEEPLCIINCGHKWMTFSYACLRKLCCCCQCFRRLRPPSFSGKCNLCILLLYFLSILAICYSNSCKLFFS